MDHNIELKRIIINKKFFVDRHDDMDEEEDDWQMHILSYHFQSWLCGPFWFAYEQWLHILQIETKYHFKSILWGLFFMIIKFTHFFVCIFCHSQSIFGMITLLLHWLWNGNIGTRPLKYDYFGVTSQNTVWWRSVFFSFSSSSSQPWFTLISNVNKGP